MVTVQHRKSISCSLIYFFLYIFFFMSPRVKRFGSIWRLGDIFSAVCVAAQDIDLLSIYFLFLSLFCARKNAALPIAGRFSLRLWAANWIADSLLSLIIAPHINTHNPFFHKLWCWPPNFSFFFFRGNTVSHSAAAICYIWSSRYIFLSHPSILQRTPTLRLIFTVQLG